MRETSEAIDAQRLMELLTQQRDLYRRLRQLADQQRGLISGDQPEKLLDLLRERQNLVGRLAQLNMQLAPYRRNWGGTYGSLPEDLRNQAGVILEEINKTLQVILKADREDGALLSVKKQMIAAEANSVTGGRTANAAYAKQNRTRGNPTADISG